MLYSNLNLNNQKNLLTFPSEFNNSIFISALNLIGIDELINAINSELFLTSKKVIVTIPYKNGQLISMFHKYGQVDKVEHGIGSVEIHGILPNRLISEFERSNVFVQYQK